MGGGLAFLTKKSFNPANWSNQRQVWEARQQHATEQRRITEREAQLKREREEEEMARMMGGEEEGGRKALGFMYEGGRIPGLKREEQTNKDDDEFGKEESGVGENGSGSLFERQPGDDDAAAAFRAMLARGTVEETRPTAETPAMNVAVAPTDEQEEKTEHVDNRTALEKAVGRGINSGSGVTLTQQMERFPQLKHAPMVLQKPKDGEAEQSTEVAGLNFKPLGQVLRNVKCLSCGKWGHSKGDRECEVSGWDPFSMGASMSASAAAKALPASKESSDLQVTAPNQTEEHTQRKKKKEKRRYKEDRHKRKRKHKHRRRRSPSYSSESDSDSYHSRRRESSRRRKHKRRRERSRSPSYSDDSRKQRDVIRENDDRERR